MNKQINTKTGIESKRLESLLDAVEDILDSVRSNKVMHGSKIPDFESEESTAQRRNQSDHKLRTPNQMHSRLPIALAQLKAGYNSQKHKNEIRQILYSLYRSKKLTKQICKSVVGVI